MHRLHLIRHLFDESAARYERDIVPVLAPLTADFVTYAHPQTEDRVLDVGTGTGIAARLIAPHVRRVVGLDISFESLRVASPPYPPTPSSTRREGEKRTYVQGDINHMPLTREAFSLVIASFGLNATEPDRSLRAIRRVTAPGGRAVIQEWGPVGPMETALEQILMDHILDDPGSRVTALRAWIDENPSVWRDQLQDADDYRDWLEDLGFRVEEATESAPVTVRLTPEQYLTFRLAWTYRYEEVQAMDDDTRAAFYAASHACLADYTSPDGFLHWRPTLFRVRAQSIHVEDSRA